MSELNYINSKKNIILYLGLILTLGLILRFYYLPYDVPIVTDGFYSFVYASKTVFEGNLPVGYVTTNTGWANFLSLFFSTFFPRCCLKPTKCRHLEQFLGAFLGKSLKSGGFLEISEICSTLRCSISELKRS